MASYGNPKKLANSQVLTSFDKMHQTLSGIVFFFCKIHNQRIRLNGKSHTFWGLTHDFKKHNHKMDLGPRSPKTFGCHSTGLLFLSKTSIAPFVRQSHLFPNHWSPRKKRRRKTSRWCVSAATGISGPEGPEPQKRVRAAEKNRATRPTRRCPETRDTEREKTYRHEHERLQDKRKTPEGIPILDSPSEFCETSPERRPKLNPAVPLWFNFDPYPYSAWQ